jgi:hypothetical protein
MDLGNLINKITFTKKIEGILKISYAKMSIDNLKSLLIDTEMLLTEALEFHKWENAEYESNYESNIRNKSRYDKLIEEKNRIIENSYNELSPIRKIFTISPKSRKLSIYPHLNNTIMPLALKM